MDLTIGFVSLNLVDQANFIEFRDSQNFTFFEASGVGDTWQAMGVTHGNPCVNMHVLTRHMEIHVSTCMEYASKYK